MLKNVLIGTNVSYTSAASPFLLTSGQIGVYSVANDGTYTLITSAISAAQAKLPVVIAQGVPAGRNIKMFTIQPGEKIAYLGTNYADPIPNVFVIGYDGVTASYNVASGIAGTYDFKIQNLTYGNPPFPTVGSTPFFQTAAAATPIAIVENIVKDVNNQFLISENDVMPAQRFAFAEILSAVTTAAPVSTPTATVTNGSTSVTLSTTSTSIVPGVYIKFGSATATTAAIYKVLAVNGTAVTLEYPYVNSSIAVGATLSNLVTGFVAGATVVAANAGIRVTETGNTFNGSNVLQPMPNKILNVSCNVNLSGTPVQNNQVVARAFTSAIGTVATNYVSAAGATSSGLVVTVGSTVGLIEGMVVSVTAGTGVFAAGTRVAAIVDATTFVVDTPITTALSGGASVVTGLLPTYTEGNGTYPQIFKKELTAAGYSGFINRIFLPDNPANILYSVPNTKYVTIGLQYGTSVNDYTAQGYKAGETLSAILALPNLAPQSGTLGTILNSINW